MKFAAWRQQEGMTQGAAADYLGCSQPYISQIERTRDPITPGRDVIRRAYVLSRGEVTPNDWYDVPAWEAELIELEARAELARAAA